MKSWLTAVVWSLCGVCASADPVSIPNAGFETPAMNAGTLTNTLSSWTGASGTTNANAFIEHTLSFQADGNQHLGVLLNYDVWQNLGAVFEANKVYTLTVAVGNRSGSTLSGNSSQYALADSSGLIYKTGAVNASTIPAGTFGDGPTVTVDTFDDPCSAGKPIRILLRARGTGGRSMFDKVRLESAASVPNGRPSGILDLPTAVTSTAATFNGTVTDPGSAAPVVRFYYDTSDKGGDKTLWANSAVVSGAQTGTFSLPVTGLTFGTTYYVRAHLTNASGEVWCAPCRSFTTTFGPPVVANAAASGILTDSARLGGSVTSTGGQAPTVAVHYGVTDGGTDEAVWASVLSLGQSSGTVTGTVSGLSAGTTYFYRAKATNTSGTAWAPASGSFTTAMAPNTANIAAAGVTFDSAVIGAAVSNSPDFPPTVDIFYGTADGGTNPSAWQKSRSLGGVISEKTEVVTGLLPATQYYYRARAVNNAGPGWAPASATFTTGTAQLARITNTGAKNIAATLAEITGTVVSTGGDVPVITMYWGTVPGGTDPAAWTGSRTLGPDAGNFSTCLTGLTPQTTYFFTSRAVNGSGAAWAPSAGTFTSSTTEPAGVVINEIHYDPIDHTRLTEFIELHNPTANDIDLSGWRFTSGVSYVIPAGTTISAGGFRVIAQKPGDFAVLYPTAGTALGPWTGKLKNSTDIVRLETAAGALVDEVDYKSGFPWPVSAKGGGTAAALLHPALDNGLGSSWRSSSPTPNRANTVLLAGASVAAPAIRDVDHTPRKPVSGQPVLITARVTDPDGVGSVNCLYQTVLPGSYIRRTDAAYNNSANWVTLPMTDDGSGGDAVAGDCLYTATVPASVQGHRRLIRYRIQARDVPLIEGNPGNLVTVPYTDDEQPNFAYFCYNGAPAWTGAMRPTAFAGFSATPAETYPAALINSIEPYHLIAVESDVATCQYNGPTDSTPYRGTLVYDGEVYDHITFNIRGIGSTRVSGKNKWGLKFNRARDFQAFDNWGRPFLEKWNSFGLDANASPWASVHRGSAGVEEALSYRIFELGGMTSLRTTYVHWRVIRKATETPAVGSNVSDSIMGGTVNAQYSSDLWGLYLSLEPTEGNLLGERGLPDGNIYAIEGNNGDQKYQSATQPGGTDWNNFRNGVVQTNQTEQWYRDNIDLEQLYTYAALNRLIGNVDVRPGDNYRFYHRPAAPLSDNRWSIMGYDHDMQFIAAAHWGGTMDGVVVAGQPNAVRAMMRHPAIARDYRNRCRELLSLLASDPSPSGGQVGQLVDEYAQLVNPAGQARTWADIDAALWNLNPRSAGGGGNSGQSEHRGNFFRAVYRDGGRGGLDGTIATGTWLRNLPDPDNDSFSNHEGLMQWFVNFTTNTWPTGQTWTRKATSSGPGAGGAGTDNSPDRQKGYGYKYLEWESLYGGNFNGNVNPPVTDAKTDYPARPAISYAGAAGFPANDLRFASGDFSDPQGAATIATVQWRIGEISAPGLPFYDPSLPRIYEIEPVWTSPEIATASPAGIPQAKVPASRVRAGHTYRARVRHKDATGNWSLWSEPVQFIAGVSDTSLYSQALRITEINYNPGAVTAAEASAPGWNAAWSAQDFEFVEVTNISSAALDLSDVRFTKGVDFDFPAGFQLAAGAAAVVVKTPGAFAVRYPGITPAGSYGADSLNNSGEELKLSYGTGNNIHTFIYGDRSPWPSAPDGGGTTLVLTSPENTSLSEPDGNRTDGSFTPGSHGDPAEWRASRLPYGSPGTDDRLSFGQWGAGYGQTDPAADPEADGLPNLLEYALTGDPASPSAAALPQAGTAEENGEIYLTLTYTRPAWTSDLEWHPEFSTGLAGWLGNGVLTAALPGPGSTVTETWRSPLPVSQGAQLFGRVRVVKK